MDASPGDRPFDPRLSQQQALALISEAQSAQNLLRDSIAAIKTLREPILHGDAVFTLGSIGVEKAMKVLLGCDEVERTGSWPSLDVLRGWGHDVETLSERLQAAVRTGLPRATASGYAASLATWVDDSTVLPLIFATLSRYGRSGRFHYLDVLATDQPGRFDAPRDYWTRLENHISETDPAFQDVPYDDPGAFDTYLERLSERIADELDSWWFATCGLAIQGCLGDLGKKLGFMLWDPARAVPAAIA